MFAKQYFFLELLNCTQSTTSNQNNLQDGVGKMVNSRNDSFIILSLYNYVYYRTYNKSYRQQHLLYFTKKTCSNSHKSWIRVYEGCIKKHEYIGDARSGQKYGSAITHGFTFMANWWKDLWLTVVEGSSGKRKYYMLTSSVFTSLC